MKRVNVISMMLMMINTGPRYDGKHAAKPEIVYIDTTETITKWQFMERQARFKGMVADTTLTDFIRIAL